MEHPAIKISKAKNGEYYFNIIAENGHTLATSETYKTKSGCENGADSVINAFVKPFFPAETRSISSRSNIARQISKLNSAGIETMIDVGGAMVDGTLTLDKE